MNEFTDDTFEQFDFPLAFENNLIRTLWDLIWDLESCHFHDKCFMNLWQTTELMVVKANPQDTVVGHSAGRNYLKKDCIDVIRCLTEKRLNCFMAAFHAGQELPVVCDPDPCV